LAASIAWKMPGMAMKAAALGLKVYDGDRSTGSSLPYTEAAERTGMAATARSQDAAKAAAQFYDRWRFQFALISAIAFWIGLYCVGSAAGLYPWWALPLLLPLIIPTVLITLLQWGLHVLVETVTRCCCA
jgi:hypothetical protein